MGSWRVQRYHGSHIFSLTNFPDFSSIFPQFSSIFCVSFNEFNKYKNLFGKTGSSISCKIPGLFQSVQNSLTGKKFPEHVGTMGVYCTLPHTSVPFPSRYILRDVNNRDFSKWKRLNAELFFFMDSWIQKKDHFNIKVFLPGWQDVTISFRKTSVELSASP